MPILLLQLPLLMVIAGVVGLAGLAALLALAPAAASAASDPSRGLWVGEVTLNKVNETTVGINAANPLA